MEATVSPSRARLTIMTLHVPNDFNVVKDQVVDVAVEI
jgi:hypothetical protein